MIPMVNRIELWTGWLLAAAAAVTAGILIVTGMVESTIELARQASRRMTRRSEARNNQRPR